MRDTTCVRVAVQASTEACCSLQELRQLQELEAAAGFVPDPEIDAFMKVRQRSVDGLRRLFDKVETVGDDYLKQS